jgi:hypothetical protein
LSQGRLLLLLLLLEKRRKRGTEREKVEVEFFFYRVPLSSLCSFFFFLFFSSLAFAHLLSASSAAWKRPWHRSSARCGAQRLGGEDERLEEELRKEKERVSETQ